MVKLLILEAFVLVADKFASIASAYAFVRSEREFH